MRYVALLATMWLRPGIAQDLIALATGVRAQSPDPAAAGPALGSYPTIPFNNVPSAGAADACDAAVDLAGCD